MTEQIIVLKNFTSTDLSTKGTNFYKGQILDGDLFSHEYEEILIHNEYAIRKLIMDLNEKQPPSPEVFVSMEETPAVQNISKSNDPFTITEVEETPPTSDQDAPFTITEVINMPDVSPQLKASSEEMSESVVKINQPTVSTSEETSSEEINHLVNYSEMVKAMEQKVSGDIDIQIKKDEVDIHISNKSDMEERIIGPLLITLVAIAGAVASGYMTVMGYSSLFPNAGFVIMSIIATLEVAKFSIASLVIHQKSLDMFHRSMLGMFAVILVIMAAVGHYGYLSKAYGSSYSVITTNDAAIKNIDSQLTQLKEDKVMLKSQLDGIPDDWVTAKRKMFKTVIPKIEKIDDRITKLNDEKSALIKGVSSKDYQNHNTMNESAKLLGMTPDQFANYVIATFAMVIDPLIILLASAASSMRRRSSTKS